MELFETILTGSIGTSLLGGIGWLLRDLYQRKLVRKAEQKKEGYLEGLRSIAKVFKAMDVLRQTSEITRVLLLEVSNGGNVPRPGSRMYASAINVKHDHSEKEQQILERYNMVQIDDSYINMCISVQETQKPFRIDMNELNHSLNLLESFYLTEGIKYSEVYHIYTDGKEEKMFILSVSTANEGERFSTEGIRALINSELNIIKSAFEKYRNAS